MTSTDDLRGFTVLDKLTQRTCLLLTCLQAGNSSSQRDAALPEMKADITLDTEESSHQQPRGTEEAVTGLSDISSMAPTGTSI